MSGAHHVCLQRAVCLTGEKVHNFAFPCRCMAAGVDRVFVEHPIFERAARDIYGANYTYVDSDAGVPDLDLRWSILSQAALAAPVVLWPPPSRQCGGLVGHKAGEQAGTAAEVDLPAEWEEVTAAARAAAKHAALETAAQQERLACETDSRAEEPDAMAEAVSHTLPDQLQQGGGSVPASEPRVDTGPGGSARSPGAASQPSAAAVHPVSAEHQQASAEAVTSEPHAAAAEYGPTAPAGERRRLAGTSPPAAAPDGPFEDGVIFVGTPPHMSTRQRRCSLHSLQNDESLAALFGALLVSHAFCCAGNDWPCAPLVLRLQHAVRTAQDGAPSETSADTFAPSKPFMQPRTVLRQPPGLSSTAMDGHAGSTEQQWSRADAEQLPETHEPASGEDATSPAASAAAAVFAHPAARISSADGRLGPEELQQEVPGRRQGFWKRVGAMLRNARVAFCIHNLAYQGVFPTVTAAAAPNVASFVHLLHLVFLCLPSAYVRIRTLATIYAMLHPRSECASWCGRALSGGCACRRVRWKPHCRSRTSYLRPKHCGATALDWTPTDSGRRSKSHKTPCRRCRRLQATTALPLAPSAGCRCSSALVLRTHTTSGVPRRAGDVIQDM